MKLDIKEERSFEVFISLDDIKEELKTRLVQTGTAKTSDEMRFQIETDQATNVIGITVRWERSVDPKRPQTDPKLRVLGSV